METGALAVTWAKDGRSVEYLQQGKPVRFDVASRRIVPFTRRRAWTARQHPGAGARPPVRVGAVARRHAQGVLPRPQPVGERHVGPQRGRDHHRRQRERRASSTAPRAGCTARSSTRTPRCGGRPTARSSPTTASTRARCRTTSCSSTRRRSRPRSTSRRIPRPARRIRSSTCSCTTSRRRQTTRVDVRDGKPFDDDVVGHYVYSVAWTPDGTELHVQPHQPPAEHHGVHRLRSRDTASAAWSCARSGRRAGPRTTRTMHVPRRRTSASSGRPSAPASATTTCTTSRGKLLATLTQASVRGRRASCSVDEKAGVLFYMARERRQPHEAAAAPRGARRQGRHAGSPTRRSTTPSRCRRTAGTSSTSRRRTTARPSRASIDAQRQGAWRELATSDAREVRQRSASSGSSCSRFKAADGVTELHGMLHKPSNFDPTRKYPVLVTVYAGPATNGARETFTLPHPLHGVRLPRAVARLAQRRRAAASSSSTRSTRSSAPSRSTTRRPACRSLVDAPVRRPVARRHLRHVVRRLRLGDGAAAAPRRLPGRVRHVAGDRLAPLRHDLHRAVHVDAAGERGGLRRRQRDDTTRTSSRAA